MTRKKWHLRGLTSLFTTAGFLVMSITGLAAYIVPQGRIAYWTDWHFLGLSKTQWGNIHIISSLLFIIAGSFHIWFNWKPLMNYLFEKGGSAMRLKKEIALASIAAVLVVAAGIRPFPPLNWLLDLNGWAKAAWAKAPDYEPPFGHAEEVSFKTLASKQHIEIAAALTALEDAGFGSVDPDAKIIDTARALGTTPRALYSAVRHLESPPLEKAGTSFTAAQVEEKFAGSGIGNKTIAEIAEQTGQDATSIKRRLDEAGVFMSEGGSVKQAADANGLSAPIELLKTMLVEDYRPGGGD